MGLRPRRHALNRCGASPRCVMTAEVGGRNVDGWREPSHGPQRGLLQLTFEDADRYRCDFDWAEDRTLSEHDPQKDDLTAQKQLALRSEDPHQPTDRSAKAAVISIKLLVFVAARVARLRHLFEADDECSICMRANEASPRVCECSE